MWIELTGRELNQCNGGKVKSDRYLLEWLIDLFL